MTDAPTDPARAARAVFVVAVVILAAIAIVLRSSHC